MVHRENPDIVPNESEFITVIRLANISANVQIEIVLIPKTKLVIGKKSFPARYAFLSKQWQGVRSKPTIMDFLRNGHRIIGLGLKTILGEV